mmetsp:Transcript_121447/g.259310  ORF Transcript_121447/g.259310 Transcript_121447/m.259310 type:complete len:201 (+) Transcript_121447:878-1480(+)
MQWTRVTTCPHSERKCSLSSRTWPSNVRRSSLSSRAPLQRRSKRWWSSISSRRSSAIICIRSPASCWSRLRSASASIQISIFPCMYRCSSLMSWWPLLISSVRCALSMAHWWSILSTRLTAAVTSCCSLAAVSVSSCSSLMLMLAIFSTTARMSFCISFLSRLKASMAGMTSAVIFRSTLLMVDMILLCASWSFSSERSS